VVQEIHHAREIVRRGTSAHRQLQVYHDALAEGADKHTALQQVVDMIAGETLVGV
jgi:carboxylate-amine ligase